MPDSMIYPTGLPPVTDFIPWLFLAVAMLSMLAGSWCPCNKPTCTRRPHMPKGTP